MDHTVAVITFLHSLVLDCWHYSTENIYKGVATENYMTNFNIDQIIVTNLSNT